jgi:Skp family chaperone for outer membrane proteins
MPEIHSGRALAMVLLSLLVPAFAAIQDAKGRVTIHNTCRVYYPAVVKASQTYKKIGVVTSRKVFEATPEYKQIARRKLTPNTAEWCFLAKAASDKFKAAVDKTVKGGRYDLIAENGAITVEGQTTYDVTSEVLAHLPAE